MAEMERNGPNGGFEETRHEARAAVGEATSAVKQAGKRLADAGRQAAHNVADKVKGEALHQKDQATGSVNRIAEGLERTASGYSGEDQWAGDLLNAGAASLKKAANYLASAQPDDVLDDVERLARRNPTAFIGVSFALGFLLARVSKLAADSGHERRFARDTYEDPLATGFAS